MSENQVIYCFIAGKWGDGDVSVTACIIKHNEQGDDVLSQIAGHVSSGIDWAKSDIGYSSKRRHDRYAELFPDGFTLEWVDDLKQHAILKQFVEADDAAAD